MKLKPKYPLTPAEIHARRKLPAETAPAATAAKSKQISRKSSKKK